MSESASIFRVEGPNLVLRLIEPGDADYVYELRTNPDYNTHLSPVSGTVADQRAWIEKYKTRESVGLEYYYVIERRADGQRCGVVRLYDIEGDHFTWGSWILGENKTPKAALESAVLSFGIGFEALGKRRALVDVRRGNVRALAFYRRLCMFQVRSDDLDIFFEYPFERYEADRDKYLKILMAGAD
ncbi:GNAT family N-acetyltransferase [Maritimibacter sp. DP07]|uniref:GNAT family N-acetyltransferase n=1 Tax=Maritimibacter harenae TaxID=2606218 RepID=A0A845M9W8_9RHOB|nr:GNAT family N-acetyltransferase [Maritimibacter harenae]MZR13834.1 GNAT family N-acetyltransferase [Maritimibacter harenae]